MDEMKDAVSEKKGFVKAMWCGDEACEDEIKAQTGGVTSRCIPMEEEHLSDVCVCCGKPAKHMVYWGKSILKYIICKWAVLKQEWISSLLEEIRSVLQRCFSINNIEEIR